ncbi:MAG: SH3 domain-containing protein, partial [Clostridia bacterium]
MGKKILILILAIILSLGIGFGAGMVVQNGGFSGLFGDKEEDAPSLEGKVVTVGQNTANVYEKADANSEVIYSMSDGETATCVEQSDEWLKLEIIDGVYGYAHAELFSLATDYDIANDTEKQEPAEPEVTYVTPTVNVLDIYKGESTDYQIVTTVEYGAILELTKKGQTWSQVTTLDGQTGYVLTSDIETTDYDPDALVVEVTNSFVNLRSEASSDSDKVGTLNRGDTATYLGEEENFYKIRLEDGTECYVSKDYTELKNTSGQPAAT